MKKQFSRVVVTFVGLLVGVANAAEPTVKINTLDNETVDVAGDEVIRAFKELMKSPERKVTADIVPLPDGTVIAKKPRLHFQGQEFLYGYKDNLSETSSGLYPTICKALGFTTGSYQKVSYPSSNAIVSYMNAAEFIYEESNSLMHIALVEEVHCKN